MDEPRIRALGEKLVRGPKRFQEVARHLAEGHDAAHIAVEMEVLPNTARQYIRHLVLWFGLSSLEAGEHSRIFAKIIEAARIYANQ
jgi:hypothetical protein